MCAFVTLNKKINLLTYLLNVLATSMPKPTWIIVNPVIPKCHKSRSELNRRSRVQRLTCRTISKSDVLLLVFSGVAYNRTLLYI